jgi:hypothetical protein
MLITGTGNDRVHCYTLTTPWNITTSTYEENYSVSGQETLPNDIFFSSDGTQMYILGDTGNDVNQYILSTPWVPTSATFQKAFSIGGQEGTPSGLFFSSDGTQMYITGTTGDDVNQYILSTAWDIGTATYQKVFSVSSQELTPTDVFFSSAGDRMYIIGTSGDDVNQYTLSTAWDVGTATYQKVFSVASQENTPSGVFFSASGNQMYVLGESGQDINQYVLSTAWDVGTASYQKVFSVASQETLPKGLFFSPDGRQLYVVGTTGDDVNQYTLSTPWDIGTALYYRSFSVSGQDTAPQGLFIIPNIQGSTAKGYRATANNGTTVTWTPAEIVVSEIIAANAITANQLQISANEPGASRMFFNGGSNRIEIYDSSGTLRVALGNLTDL